MVCVSFFSLYLTDVVRAVVYHPVALTVVCSSLDNLLV